MNDKPAILDFDECDRIGNEVSEKIYNNIRTNLNKRQFTQGQAPYLEVIAMDLAMSDKSLSDYIPNIETLFREEYRALDELQKHCLFLYLMTSEKDETEIVESMMWTFEEEIFDWGLELINMRCSNSVKKIGSIAAMMTIQNYLHLFSNLRTAKKLGLPAPHKAVLLLSVMELVEAGVITGNRIELSDRLEKTFLKLWKRYVGTSVVFQAKVATPFWHLQNEPFWSLYMNNGKDLSTVTSPYSVSRLRENTHAIIDQELFELMRDEDSRARLRVLLISQYLQDQHIPLDKSLSVLAIIGTLLNFAA